MKKWIALLLVAVMVCACVPALAMFDNLGWEAADPDHRALTDEIHARGMKCMIDVV